MLWLVLRWMFRSTATYVEIPPPPSLHVTILNAGDHDPRASRRETQNSNTIKLD
jgi:hypothetical protein